MRQLVVIGSLVSALALAAPTGAGERPWYLGLDAGIEFGGDGSSYGTVDDNGWAGLLTVGQGITSHFNLEGELGIRSTDSTGYFANADISQLSFMVNANYEAPLSKDVSFEIGAGVGANLVDYEYVGGFSTTETKLATQLKLGAVLDVSEGTAVVATYRYMETWGSDADNSTLTVGLRFDL
jgi:hypothetical protein